MLAIPHMLTGGAIGRTVARSWLAWPLAFASHFVLDTIPHLDSHGLFGHPGGGITPAEACAALLDFTVGAVLVAAMAWGSADRWRVLGGAGLGIAIDVIEQLPAVGPWLRSWSGTAWFTTFHHAIQHNVPPADWVLGFGTQVAVVGLATWLLLRRGQTAGDRSSTPALRELGSDSGE